MLQLFIPINNMKITNIVLRTLLGLFLLMPLFAAFGLIPEPTEEMYSTPEAWAYMSALMDTGFMMWAITIVSVVCGVLFLIGRTALGAVLLAPFTVNVILFHIFLDSSPITPNAIPAYILLALNVYFLWINRAKYQEIWAK